jgi:polyribonucleotide nucleotidyltransferase
MKPEVSTVTVDLFGGKRLSFETGKLAKQAHGSVVVRMGDNVVLATATANPDPREGIDFFPLTVDYREYTYAGGRIPRRLHQARRPSQRARGSNQPADRSSRPPAVPRRLQVRDPSHRLRALRRHRKRSRRRSASTAPPAALTISDIPFSAPSERFASALVGGQFIINPTYSEMRDSLLNIMVVGTADGIVMIESGAKEVKEEDVVDAIEFATPKSRRFAPPSRNCRPRQGKPKRAVTPPEFDQAYYDQLKGKASAPTSERPPGHQKHPKAESHNLVKDLKKKLQAAIPKEDDEAAAPN